MSNNNLAHVKIGDKLYLQNSERTWGGERVIPYSVFTVERLTSKQIVTKSQYGREARFRIEDGVQIGGSGSSFYRAQVPTPEMIADQVKSVQVRNAQNKVQDKIRNMANLTGKRDQQDDFWLAMSKIIEEFELKEKA